MMAVLAELYQYIPLPLTLTWSWWPHTWKLYFSAHSYPAGFKLCFIVTVHGLCGTHNAIFDFSSWSKGITGAYPYSTETLMFFSLLRTLFKLNKFFLILHGHNHHIWVYHCTHLYQVWWPFHFQGYGRIAVKSEDIYVLFPVWSVSHWSICFSCAVLRRYWCHQFITLYVF